MNKEEWTAHVGDYRNSNLSKRAYASQHDLPYSQFLYWIKKLTPPVNDAPDDFVPAKLVNSTERATTDSLGVISFPNGAQLHIHDTALVPSLVYLLQGRP